MATEPKNIADDDEVSVKELIISIQKWISYLWSKWKVILILGLVGGALGLWRSFVKTPVYTATTTFVLEGGDQGRIGRLAGMAALAGFDLGGDAGGLFQGDNILELYKSRKMLVRTLLSSVYPDSGELLVERYIAYNGLQDAWQGRPDLLELDFRRDPTTLNQQNLRLRDSVLSIFVKDLRENILSVDKPDRKLSIIQVDVTSPDEVFSKSFNEKLVQGVNEFYIQTKTKKSTDNIALLEAKVDSVRSVMEGAIYSAARVSDATPNLNPTRQVQRIGPTQEAQFSAEANKAMLSQLLQNLELTKLNQMQEQPLIQLVDEPVYPLKVERLGKLKGIILGGFLFGFLAVLWLIAVRYYRDIMEGGDERKQI